jgi:hypothetical protein
VVVNVNSSEVSFADFYAVVNAIHELAAGAN